MSLIRQTLVIINPVAGLSTAAVIRQTLDRAFAQIPQATVDYYETTENESLYDLVQSAVQRGYTLVVAAGGDGTVASVASGLIHSDVPLGILPTGSGNVLAQELGISQNLEVACRLLSQDHTTTVIDAMQVGERYFFLQVGAGFDAVMMRETPRALKRRVGRFAYLWVLLTRLLGHQPARFTIVADGRGSRVRAATVIVANGGALGLPQFRLGPDINLQDGRLNISIIKARSLLDYLGIAWDILWHRQHYNRNIRYIPIRDEAILHADRTLPVQGDGEVIGDVPVRVQLIPGALRVLVPAEASPGLWPIDDPTIEGE